MRRSILALGLLLLAAGPVAGSNPNPYRGFIVEILVDGRSIPQYAAHGTSYVEALKGREYEIRLHNPLPVRVAVALSVDGLNTIDARHTTAELGRKWVIGPYETITISGWQTSLAHARRFYFTSEERSYAQWLGKTENLGIISAVFFRERVVRPIPLTAPHGAPRLEDSAGAAGAPAPQSRADRPAAGENEAKAAGVGVEDYAATGIGRTTDHAVRQIHMDLEDTPASSIDIRYEYRPQLVRLGILPRVGADSDPLARREQSRGFVSGFCPEPPKKW
jgi:hypothetical protein